MSNCDWCNASLEGNLVYEISTVINNTPTMYTIGAACCMRAGRHADFANEHNCPPMNSQLRADHANVSLLFALAKRRHFADPSAKTGEAKELFRTAYQVYKRLSANDKRRVTR